MARASETTLSDVHGELGAYFLRLIRGQIPEMVEATVTKTDAETGEVTTYKAWKETGLMVRPTAGEVAVITKFLKDNAIVGVAVEGSEVSDLQKALEARRKRRGALPTARDVREAERELGHLMN